jgi:hypothetical protein
MKRSPKADSHEYWRKIWRNARTVRVELEKTGWCDQWHMHLDLNGRGNINRTEHRRHLKPLFTAFYRVQHELRGASVPCQVFLSIHPKDAGSDALYVHTPNPQSEFPLDFSYCSFVDYIPPLLMGLLQQDRYRIGACGNGDEQCFIVLSNESNSQFDTDALGAGQQGR